MALPPPTTPHQKYAFDTEFFELVADQKKPKGGVEAMAAIPTPQPRQKIFDEGFAAGLKEGINQAQADLAVMQQHLQNTLMALQKGLEDRESQMINQSLALIRVTLHHLVGEMVTKWPEQLLEHHLRSLVPLIKSDESLTLRIHPAARGYHEKLQLPHASILGLPMMVTSDTTLGSTDAVVEWKNGGVESRLAEHLKLITTLISGAGGVELPVPALPTAPDLSAQGKSVPTPAPSAPAPATDSPITTANEAARSRAEELLGDDELVDALKPK